MEVLNIVFESDKLIFVKMKVNGTQTGTRSYDVLNKSMKELSLLSKLTLTGYPAITTIQTTEIHVINCLSCPNLKLPNVIS